METSSINTTHFPSTTFLPSRINHSNSDHDRTIFIRELTPAFAFVSLLLPIGLIGNILVCYIYQRNWRKNRRSSRLFIIALAWIDLSNCIVTMPFEIVLLMNPTTFDNPVVCKFVRSLTFMLNGMSSIVLIGIAVDRHIVFRYSRKKAFGVKQAKACIVVAIFISAVTCWPALVLYGTHTYQYKGVKSVTCLIDDKFKGTVFPYAHSIYLISSSLLVDIVLISLYFFTWRSIHNTRKRMLIHVQNPDYSRDSEGYWASFLRCCKISSDTKLTNTPSPLLTPASTPDFCCEPCSKSTGLKNQSTCTLHDKNRSGSGTYVAPDCMRFGPKTRVTKSYIMMFSVTVVYIATYLPFCVIAIIRCITATFHSELPSTDANIYHLFLRSYMLSMAANPIIYCFVNKSFRKDCLNIFIFQNALKHTCK
jgi:hypothetical protein